MTVLVTGGTGFVGREVLRKLNSAGHKVRLLARDPDRAAASLEAMQSPHPTGHPFPVGQGERQSQRPPFEIIAGDVVQPDSLRGAAEGCHAVVHLVGIISEIGKQTFENLHLHATQNVLLEAKRARVRRWIHMSALGARPKARSRYHQTKWAAEEAVRTSGLDWTIFRPSIIYGRGDGFVNLFARVARWSPLLPVMGNGKSRLQPVSVENVARCFAGALAEPASIDLTLDLCGPEEFTFNEVLDAILAALGKRRLKLHIPMPIARLQATMLEALFLRLLRQAPPLTRDQLLMLEEDNVGDGRTAEDLFHLESTHFEHGIRSYLIPEEAVH